MGKNDGDIPLEEHILKNDLDLEEIKTLSDLKCSLDRILRITV